ncbi:hypothetical protein BYT27DRAFT_7213211 [Phlegmacium glaucopus]|nr:hypothetical protein BYT27DRAFT_7213211 [Phlegmacium glaucopus]
MHHHTGNPDALVLASSGLPGQAADRSSQQWQPGEQGGLDPITHAFEINTGYFHCQEHRFFYPDFNYEVVKIQARDRNAYTPPLTGAFHILNFPIDQLCEHLTARAIRLSNLRIITFSNPLSWQAFMANYTHITEMALNILTHVPSLTRIKICADMLNDRLFRALSSLSSLREVEILLPPICFDYPSRLPHIGEVLNRGVVRLRQVEYLKIPLQLVTGTLLSYLGGLSRLRYLKIVGSVNDTPYPGRLFIGCMGYLHMQSARFFENLQLLDVRDNQLQEDFFSNHALTKIFSNTKLIKT